MRHVNKILEHYFIQVLGINCCFLLSPINGILIVHPACTERHCDGTMIFLVVDEWLIQMLQCSKDEAII
jgi:glycerol kinase